MNDVQLTAKEIEERVDTLLPSWGIVFKVSYVGQTKQDEWDCDQWQVTITKAGVRDIWTFPYYTGLGLRAGGDKVRLGHATRDPGRPVEPKPAAVLHSLVLNAGATNQSFNDWCADCGYSNDSIKAFQTYQECCEVGANLRRYFTREQLRELSETLQDY